MHRADYSANAMPYKSESCWLPEEQPLRVVTDSLMIIRVVLLFLTIVTLTTSISCRRSYSGNDSDCVPRRDLTNLKLIIAANQGNVEKLSDLIKSGADVNISDELFGTPLVSAVDSRNLKAVKLLLNKGANVNSKDNAGCTALIRAALTDNVEVVRLLLLQGADPNASCYPLVNGKPIAERFTPLNVSKARKNQEIVKLLAEAGAKE